VSNGSRTVLGLLLCRGQTGLLHFPDRPKSHQLVHSWKDTARSGRSITLPSFADCSSTASAFFISWADRVAALVGVGGHQNVHTGGNGARCVQVLPVSHETDIGPAEIGLAEPEMAA
jgi:hypothetical protein